MNVTIGNAPDSWGVWFPDDPKQIPWERCLDEISESGYGFTELGPYGYLPTQLPQLKDALESRGLKATAGFAMAHLEDPELWAETERQVRGQGELLAPLGAKHLVLIDDTYSNLWTGESTHPKTLDTAAWRHLIETVHRVTDFVRADYDLQVVFHPHTETHVEYTDQIELLLEQTDPARVLLCLDTGHHAYRGGDPVDFMRRHHERIPYLHLKSIDPKIKARVDAEEIPFANAVGMNMFCEPQQGSVDFLAFRDVLRDIDYQGCAIVEQDMYPTELDRPLPIAKRWRAYLQEIGLG